MKYKFSFFLGFLFMCTCVYSQKIKYSVEPGLGIEYNYQTRGAAPEIRVEIPIYKKYSITPRLSYFPGFNPIHELYFGLDAGYHLLEYKKFSFYVFVGGYYDYWVNYEKFTAKVAKKNNLVFEGGAGIEYHRGCINPFLEHRYDTKWKEGTTVIGVKINFGKCGSGGRFHVISCPDFG